MDTSGVNTVNGTDALSLIEMKSSNPIRPFHVITVNDRDTFINLNNGSVNVVLSDNIRIHPNKGRNEGFLLTGITREYKNHSEHYIDH